jgi:hypothetical protein
MPKITKLLIEISDPAGSLLKSFTLEGTPDADRVPLPDAVMNLLAEKWDLEEQGQDDEEEA